MSSLTDTPRPSRDEIAPAAADLLRRRGAEILGTARRYAATPEDADDAYQRGLEILLTKAPTTNEEQLVPWLKTVVKHEAFALKRQRDRAVAVEHETLDVMSGREAPADEHAERKEELRVGAEALERLKPQETRALLLKAEGYSYKQIQEITGWTYTKVNRCLTEGRRAFLQRVSGIESGDECERLAPLLSKLADGEADANDLRLLRPHLRGCGACRATLADYRRAPAAVAALATPAALVAAGAAPASGALGALGGWLSDKAHGVLEAVAAHKAVAVAASTAAIASGGAATVETLDREPAPRRAPAAAVQQPEAPAPRAPAPREVRPATKRERPQRRPVGSRPAAQPAADPTPVVQSPAPAPTQEAAPDQPQPTEGGEFGP